MKTRHLLLVLAAALVLGACAPPQYPLVEKYPKSYQKKFWVVQHWEGIASHVAQRLSSALAPICPPGSPLVLYVERPARFTEFNQAFHDLLITHLLGEGFGVSEDPQIGLPVRYEVQVVTHDLPHRPPPDNEVLVTTSVLTGNRYLARVSDVYYITDYDIDHYLAHAPATRLLEVVGP